MNWTQIIAEFPRSILQNESALETLAVLERNGLSTEDELIAQIGKKAEDIRKTLLDLKMNRCIEYGQSYIKLTSRGKYLLDRFGLEDPIIDDLIKELNIVGKERDDFKILIGSYRDEAFSYYLNSLSSLRAWDFCARTLPSENIKKDIFENQIGMLVLLFRDLTNWFIHSKSSDETLGKINKNLKEILLNNLTDQTLTDTPRFEDTKIFLSKLLLDNLDNEAYISKKNRGKNIGAEKVILLLNFHAFQAESKPDYWFDDFSDKRLIWIKQSKSKSKVDVFEFLNQLKKEALINQGVQSSENHALEKHAITYQQNWKINDYSNPPSDELLDLIITSKNLDDLAKRSGYEKSFLRAILSEVADKCNKLLDKA